MARKVQTALGNNPLVAVGTTVSDADGPGDTGIHTRLACHLQRSCASISYLSLYVNVFLFVSLCRPICGPDILGAAIMINLLYFH